MDTIESRSEVINEIINIGTHNPDLNTYYLAVLFVELAPEIMVFERIGVDLIQSKMQAMVNANHPLAGVLVSYTDPVAQTTTVQQAIVGHLNG